MTKLQINVANVIFERVDVPLGLFSLCRPFRSSNGDWERVFKFNIIGVHLKKDHIKIRQCTKFEVLSLDCNHVQGFQRSEKLGPLYGFGGRHLRITDVWNLVITQ